LLLVPVLLVVALGVTLAMAKPSISADSVALAHVNLPFGSGHIQHVSVVSGPHQASIPVELRGDQIWPTGLIGVHKLVTIDVIVKRPGIISWLTGDTEKIRLTLMTPSASLRSHYLTLRAGEPIRLAFRKPVRVVAYSQSGRLVRHTLPGPQTRVDIARSAPAGTLTVAAAPRTWEHPKPVLISWFPAGAAASAVATPAPGTTITPHTKITLLFSKPISTALDGHLPPVSPAGAGAWHELNSHTIVFQPTGYGYGLGAKVGIGLPSGVRLAGAAPGGGTWNVPPGSTVRLQQLLSLLGYLPFHFQYAGGGVTRTPEAEELAAVKPPAGTFHWRYSNVPGALRAMWAPGQAGTMTRGAVMAFQNDQGLVPDGVAGPALWKSLITAAVEGKRSTFGYTFVSVSEASPETLSLWHSGQTVLTAAVNTGIPSRPTALGTYAVYEHIPSGTMSGTNPDGSHYNDTGIPWISYFNGGDALHGFIRGSYGTPQSLGCVEMPFATAGKVYPYTPIGTLVHVA
jgi:peptidoglycan hydrolase-like protein with peptidoglycan-binding domain